MVRSFTQLISAKFLKLDLSSGLIRSEVLIVVQSGSAWQLCPSQNMFERQLVRPHQTQAPQSVLTGLAGGHGACRA